MPYPHGVTVQDAYLVVDPADKEDHSDDADDADDADADSVHTDKSPFATPNQEVEQPPPEPTDNVTDNATNATATPISPTPASLHASIASLRSRLQTFQQSFNADIQSFWQQLAEVAISSENERDLRAFAQAVDEAGEEALRDGGRALEGLEGTVRRLENVRLVEGEGQGQAEREGETWDWRMEMLERAMASAREMAAAEAEAEADTSEKKVVETLPVGQ